MTNNSYSTFLGIVVLGLIILVGALVLPSCTAPERSRSVLEQSGYSDIRAGGYAFTGCGEGDTYHTLFSAKGPTGQPTRGVVCCGVFKGCTVRLR